MNTDLPVIREASEADLPAVGDALHRAFLTDPMMRFIFGEPARAAAAHRWFMTTGARYGVRYGCVHATGTPPAGAAVWLPPDATDLALERLAAVGFDAAPEQLGDDAFDRFMAVMEDFQRVHRRLMSEPHWYLMILGVEPSRQRGGLGSALLQRQLTAATQAGLPCYLETCAADNVAFYRRHGFRVGEAWTTPGGLSCWGMVRPA